MQLKVVNESVFGFVFFRSPKSDKENQRSQSDNQSSMPPSKVYQQINKKQSPNPKSDLSSSIYYAKFEKSPRKSPNRHVTFQRSSDDLIEKDVSGWARTDTLWKDQQISTGDYVMPESRQSTLDSPNQTSLTTDKKPSKWLRSIPEDLDDTELAGASKRQLIKENYVSVRGGSKQSDGKTLQDPYQYEDDDSTVEETHKPYVTSLQDDPHLASQENFRPKPDFQSPIQCRPYKFPQEVLSKIETGSVVSDSTTSSVTSQYEARFQMGLRNLDSEIGKLQASLKYSNFKSL